MHSFEYILIMLGGVLVSNVISWRLPRISTPLVQIGIGIVLTLLPISFDMTLEPELFLVLFIAPLLFEDAKKADKVKLWRLKRPILLLAVTLVFATTLVVGFTINWMTPSIPLAAAFALAAALAPTDAVSVASFKETATISDDQENLLKGEALFNDASGIVSFQFAIAAMLTGAFSLFNASVSFVLSFFGGLAVGAVLMWLRLRIKGTENITFHVLLEIITPFLIFLVAEALHVSGIIAVVAAGIVYSFSRQPQTPGVARRNIVSTSAWAVISFTLNGLVFLILGTQLPSVIRRVWSSSAAADYALVLNIALILLGILLLRFVWVLVMHWRSEPAPRGAGGSRREVVSQGAEGSRRDETATRGVGFWRTHLHDATLLSLTGAKGAITLALVLTIPLTLADGTPFPERDLIIFFASGVILLSLLLANFLVPLIAPKQAVKLRPEHEVEAVLTVYRAVIARLVEETQPEQPGQKAATEEVIRQYYRRIATVKEQNRAIHERDVAVRTRVIEWEREHTLELIDQGRVRALPGMFYLNHLSRILARLCHHNTILWELKGLAEQAAHWMRLLRQRRQRRAARDERAVEGAGGVVVAGGGGIGAAIAAGDGADCTCSVEGVGDAVASAAEGAGTRREAVRFELRDLIIANYCYVREKLEEFQQHQQDEDTTTARVAALILIELERRIARFDIPRERTGSSLQEHERHLIEVEARALEFERAAISEALEQKRMSRLTAKEMRDNVAMMELDIEEQLE
jgi:CPA1 family monovalent cation:H+ antiporter